MVMMLVHMLHIQEQPQPAALRLRRVQTTRSQAEQGPAVPAALLCPCWPLSLPLALHKPHTKVSLCACLHLLGIALHPLLLTCCSCCIPCLLPRSFLEDSQTRREAYSAEDQHV
jgi:hypothetical protein